MPDFTAVKDPALIEQVKAATAGCNGKRLGSIAGALLDGQFLHFDSVADRPSVHGSNRTLAARGMKARTRDDGNGGFYAWAVDLPKNEGE